VAYKREDAVEQYLADQVTALGGLCIKLMPTLRGLPDRLVLIAGEDPFFVELKAPQGRVAAHQQRMHDRIKSSAVVHVANTKSKVDEVMSRYK
jgi:hypothetical protein